MKKHQLIIVLLLVLAFILFSYSDIESYVNNFFQKRSLLNIHLSTVNPQVDSVAADSSNRLLIRAEVRDNYDLPVENVKITFEVTGGPGEVYPKSTRTNAFGECLAYYIPPDRLENEPENTPENDSGNMGENNPGDEPENSADFKGVNIKASIEGTSNLSTLSLSLAPVPVILIHGYQETAYIYNNMKEYIDSRGCESYTFEYSSEDGVIPAAEQLPLFMDSIKKDYLSKGVQVSRFDIVAHSMGGLVARYYTTSHEYVKRNDARKIIFVSVPHKGSVWASLGAEYFDDKGVRDMVPDSDLLVNILPSMVNKGLNNTVQAINLLGKNDEVVTPESASLSKWGIKTEIFDLGGEALSVEDLLKSGSIEARNHKAILNNTTVFDRVLELLNTELDYPQQLR
ncbi:MAG TPA: alpha/beta hydrolase [Clostridiaceae bacterium]|nr:alpha/beta hydrolase [Clostridiaceae bacterium]